jgi:hypothetical protein
MYESGMSMRDVARSLNLVNHSYVCRRVRSYQKSGTAGLERKHSPMGSINLGIASSRNPELKIKWLEAEVALLKKIVAWERGCARRGSCSPLSEN